MNTLHRGMPAGIKQAARSGLSRMGIRIRSRVVDQSQIAVLIYHH